MKFMGAKSGAHHPVVANQDKPMVEMYMGLLDATGVSFPDAVPDALFMACMSELMRHFAEVADVAAQKDISQLKFSRQFIEDVGALNAMNDESLALLSIMVQNIFHKIITSDDAMLAKPLKDGKTGYHNLIFGWFEKVEPSVDACFTAYQHQVHEALDISLIMNVILVNLRGFDHDGPAQVADNTRREVFIRDNIGKFAGVAKRDLETYKKIAAHGLQDFVVCVQKVAEDEETRIAALAGVPNKQVPKLSHTDNWGTTYPHSELNQASTPSK